MKAIRSKLTYANVVSTICLFVLLGGGAYAVTAAPKNSVTSKAIKNGQVKGADLATNSVSGPKVADGSLSGADIGGAVADSAHAANADNASHANSATSASNADTIDGHDSASFAQSGSEGWTDPAFNDGAGGVNCNWTAWSSPAYFRDGFGVVHLRGMVRANQGSSTTCGTNDPADYVMFTLPPGYRPATFQPVAATAFHNPAIVQVAADGKVNFDGSLTPWIQALQWVTISGITFRCGPSGQDGCP